MGNTDQERKNHNFLENSVLYPKPAMLLLLSLLEDPRFKKVARRSPLHKAFLQAIGTPQEGKELAVKNFSGLLDVRDAKVVKVMKDLQKAGFGTFIAGRHGRPSRLLWSWGTPVSDGAPSGPRAEAPSSGATLSSSAPLSAPLESKRPAGDTEEDGLHRIQYGLRKDFTVDLTLPADISAEEAERLSKFILALPARS
jgi:hypothetical protein